MRTLRSLVIVTVRQPPRPVPLYFADFASKPAWYAPFRVLPLFIIKKVWHNSDGTSPTFNGRDVGASKATMFPSWSSNEGDSHGSIRAFTRAVLTTVQCNRTVVSLCKSKEGTGFQNGQGENLRASILRDLAPRLMCAERAVVAV
jgi:hypothetical protein